MNYIALICARDGSKGLPGKNTKLFNGIPLIAWSIKMALSEDKISRVIVSTDSEDIALVAKKYGAEVPFLRPKNLAQDDSSEWLVWKHAINYLNYKNNEFDGLIVLPVTAPLRALEDIQNCIAEYEKGESDIVITIAESHRNPFFNMVTLSKNNNASIVIQSKNKIFRRQDAPEVFDITTVAYVVRPYFLDSNDGIFDGKVGTVKVPVDRSIDIDTKFDFEIAEYLFKKKQNKKK